MLEEFKAFLTKTNALALAIGVIIGAAAGKVVSSLVDNILMPVISLAIPGGDWRDAAISLGPAVTDAAGKVSQKSLKYGSFIGALIDFLVISLVVFLIARTLVKPEVPAPSKACPYCKEGNAVDASKCKACASGI